MIPSPYMPWCLNGKMTGIDYIKIVEAAKCFHTLLEINNNALRSSERKNVNENVEKILELCKKYEQPVLLSSDAHITNDIGNMDYVERMLVKTQFPKELIINYSKEAFKEYLAINRKENTLRYKYSHIFSYKEKRKERRLIMKSKLQIALDDITLEEALELLAKVKNDIDIVEVGTPFMMKYGMHAVSTIKTDFPELQVLCDAKIMDAGGYEAKLAFEAGADYVTVLGVTDDLTIKDCVSAAKKAGAKIMVDMICVNNLKDRINTIENLGVDVIAVHTGVDQQEAGRTPLDDLKEMRQYVKKAQLAVAGGISYDTIEEYMKYHPEIIIVGGGIAKAEDPARVAKQLAVKIHE